MTSVPATPARQRPTTWLALALLALALGMIGFIAISAVLPGHERLAVGVDSLVDLAYIVPTLVAYVTLPAVGAILATLRPGNPVGWILLAGGVALVLGDFTLAYVERSLVVGPELPGYRFADWITPAFATLAFPLLTVWLPLLFPDGRLPGPHWRPVGVLAAANTVIAVALTFVAAYGGAYGRKLPNPTAWGGDAVDVVVGATTVVSAILLVPAVLAVAIRFRRSHGGERQQMKWFVAAIAGLASSMVLLAVYQNEWTWTLTVALLALVPIAIGIAILRYRLYEIDRLISRTIGWALVTGILAGVFAIAVIGLQAVLAGVTQGETLAVAASTLAAFALFQPLRRRVQTAVDRRFDRARYDGQRTVDEFAERLRDEVEFAQIDRDIHRVIHDAVRPAHVGVWLREQQGAGR